MLKIQSKVCDAGIVLRAVVDNKFTEALIHRVEKVGSEEVAGLFKVIRSMGETGFNASLKLISGR